MTCYDPQSARALIVRIAAAGGASEDDAGIFADALIDADLHGTSTHGISRLAIYMQRVQRGLIDPAAELTVDQRRPAVMRADANHGLGQVQAVKTLDRMIPIARDYGIASATIKRSQHFGAVSYYCNRAAQENMILLAMTSCEPAMSPAGACDAFFGTNPIAASFPTGKGFPIKIDLATSKVARGNIIAANKENKPIPEDWALDPDGEATTDAAQALAGTVLTMAGHKGYALAMMVEGLSSVLSGSAIGPDIGSMYKHMDRAQDVGHFFCLLDVDAFMDIDAFKQRIDDTIDRIKRCRRRPGVDEVLVPGERSARKAAQHRRDGIPLGDATCMELTQLADHYGVPFELKTADGLA